MLENIEKQIIFDDCKKIPKNMEDNMEEDTHAHFVKSKFEA